MKEDLQKLLDEVCFLKNVDYVTHYLDGNELIIETSGDSIGYNLDTKDIRTIQSSEVKDSELEYVFNLLNQYQRTSPRPVKGRITIMCDYCANGIWFNGMAIAIDYPHIPYSFRILKRRLFNWQETYEKFNFFRMSPLEYKVFQTGSKYKRWLLEGYHIAKIMARLTPGRYKVEYFNETNAHRLQLNKRVKNEKI